MITTIIIFIIVLGLLVFVHELGHFLVARKSGMAVEEFGFGFPPRIFGLQKIDGKWKIVGLGQADPDKTVYSVNWIPFGAFVRIRGENGDNLEAKSFAQGSWSRRFLVLAAGVLMNVLAAWVLFSIGLTLGLPAAESDNIPKLAKLENVRVNITHVVKDSPANSAGLRPGDIVASINGQVVFQPAQIQEIVAANLGREIEFTIQRGKGLRVLKATPDDLPVEGRGALGVQLAKAGKLSYPWYYAPVVAAKITIEQLWAILNGLYQLITAGVGLSDIAGPAKIAQITGEAAELGAGYLLQFAAFLSLNLAVLNSLPFPALDGGRVLFLIIEKVRGKRNNQTAEQLANGIGFLVLLLLVAVVTINDIRGFGIVKRLFGG